MRVHPGQSRSCTRATSPKPSTMRETYWLLVGVLLFQLSSVVLGQNCTKNNDTIYEDANCRALWEGVVQPITIDATDMKPIHHACQDHRCTINIHNFIANCIHDSVSKYTCVCT